MYSSIEEESRKDIIQKCYWPLFKLADMGIPIGIEAPAITLELINHIDSTWVKTLSKYVNDVKVEFIGSGYSQIIGPLVPVKVNEWNQKLGLEVYDKLLSIKPQVALVNEMAYSAGIVEHYIKAGYEAIIMEWNNPRSAHMEWNNEWRYHPQKATGTNGETLPLIWADSIAFQKFQRYAHGEYEIDEYVKYIKSHIVESDRCFPLYSNDVEIFDYRPGRYNTETHMDRKLEWDRIIDLYSHLYQQEWCGFISPLEVVGVLYNDNAGNELKLESPVQPIPVKKQEKYNINRWALTGRNDLGINTKCYQIYNSFIQDENDNPSDWKELCYLWSSDFRTHITEKRWNNYNERLNEFVEKWDSKKIDTKLLINKLPQVVENDKLLSIENNRYKIVLNKNKGLTIQQLVFKNTGLDSLLGTLDHGYYDDISLGADYYSGHAVIERPGEHKVTDLGKVTPEIIEMDNRIEIKTYQKWGDYTINQNMHFNNDKITIEKIIGSNIPEKVIIRLYNFTFNPDTWDQKSLFIETHNGGSSFEKFYLEGQNISHGDIYSSLISARHGFGNTEGIFVIGDKNKSITFECDMSVSALIPSIIYKEMDGTYFFRLQYSAREMDETSQSNLNGKTICSSLSISQLCNIHLTTIR